jgi:NAD(P)H-dependent FMN reductase
MPGEPQRGAHVSDRPHQIEATTLLGVCASLKPAPGRQGRSAARSLLTSALATIRQVYPDVALLDLRDHPPPMFDGRMPHDHENPTLELLWSCVDRAGALLLSVPAYWSGVSGVFKNFIDVLSGPAYDMGDEWGTVFTGKPVGILVVGADEASARLGGIQAEIILRSTGAHIIGEPVVVSNPRLPGSDVSALSRDLVALGGVLAQHAYRAGRQGAMEKASP